MNYVQLLKLSKKHLDTDNKTRLALMGDCSTQHLATAIKGYCFYENMNIDLLEADYNLIDANLIDANSEFYQFNPDIAIIFMCSEKLYELFCETPAEQRNGFADRIVCRINNYWDTIQSNCSAKIIQMNFVEINDNAFGNYGSKYEDSFIYQLRKINYMISQSAAGKGNVFITDLSSIQNTVGRDSFFDDKLYFVAKMPISTNVLPLVAENITTQIKSISGQFKKCVILDLDNTLWGGVIGDDGLNGINIGELGIGKAFSAFQRWIKELKNRGIILAVCSKNNEETAKKPFIEHPEMILRLEDISVFVANWNDKATNIKMIQSTLNIGMDSIVFLDDNPFERNLVKSLIPDITVPELPSDPSLYVKYLKSLNLFETASVSSGDKDRTKQYQAEMERLSLQTKFESFDDYLKSLEMVATVNSFDEFRFPRIAQLTQRSNQFNLRTRRYTEDDIKVFAESDKHLTLYFELKDKFGDHGLISVIIMEKTDCETLFIDTWLMSCRVLKRGMEEYIINTVFRKAKENGFKKIIGEYIPTPKNSMVKNIYSDFGFVETDENIFELLVDEYTDKKTFIK